MLAIKPGSFGKQNISLATELWPFHRLSEAWILPMQNDISGGEKGGGVKKSLRLPVKPLVLLHLTDGPWDSSKFSPSKQANAPSLNKGPSHQRNNICQWRMVLWISFHQTRPSAHLGFELLPIPALKRCLSHPRGCFEIRRTPFPSTTR